MTFTARVTPPPISAAKIDWLGAAARCRPVNVSKSTGTASCTTNAPTREGTSDAKAAFAGRGGVAGSKSKVAKITVR